MTQRGFTEEQRDKVAKILEGVAGTENNLALAAAILSIKRLLPHFPASAAEVVEIVAEDGLPEPRDLDVALDAIQSRVYD